MHYATIILTSDNWAVGSHDNKDILLWAISDKPWLNLRTLQFAEKPTFPCQIKTNSWTNVEVNTSSTPNQDISILTKTMDTRIKLLAELVYRLRSHYEIMGVSDPSSLILKMHEYLVDAGVIHGTAAPDAKIKYLNSIRLMQDLEAIKTSTIEKILAVRDTETFQAARHHMDRMFFTNILL
jgi:hypothetical protein